MEKRTVDRLFMMTNMPIKRFLDQLARERVPPNGM